MMIVVTILHVTACLVLVLTVLLQAGKGADIGAVFGGASTTIFGSSGAGNFLTRLTTGAAIVFMATSLTLTYGSSHHIGSTIMPESATAPSRNEPVAGGAADEDEGAPPAGNEAAPAAPAAPEAPAPNAPAAP
ncbi:MAG TPA: preprotein translocase subunit SecG [Candidatus Binatia bacterium]|jgi:preprotein translocase subunit SecG